jgi:RHS repeat-associated protein
MATVENGTYTGYTYDGDNILAEYNKDDSLTTRYIRGYDLISQKKDAGETYNYLHNAHGDITKLVDSTGNVQNSYSYDAFGNTITYSEKVGNKFRYAGEQYDSITGEYYLRARYYNPTIGRFMNEDTYKGQIENPQSMNLYSYCVNNPVIYTDPSGHNGAKCNIGQGTGNGNVSNVPGDYNNNGIPDQYEPKSNSTQGKGKNKSKGTRNSDYIGKYPKAYINGIIKSYETHKKVKGRFVLDNGGQTIGYGHDLLPGENFSAGLSEQEALDLLIKDLDEKYATIEEYIKSLNSGYGYNIDINKFSENEVLFLVDFVFNRGAGLVQRPKLKKAKKPFSSLAILIIAVSKKNDKKIKKTLMEETKNTKGVYYEGLKLRRMDEYEIYKFGDFVRDYDVKRDYTKQKN